MGSAGHRGRGHLRLEVDVSGLEELVIAMVLMIAVTMAALPLLLSVVALIKAARVGPLEREIRGLEGMLFAARQDIEGLKWRLAHAGPAAAPIPVPALDSASASASVPAPPRPPAVARPRPPVPSTARLPSRAEQAKALFSPPDPAVGEGEVEGTGKGKANEGAVTRGRNLEDLLGRQLFLKAGVVIVVIGLALFLAFTLAQLGAVGKVVCGYGAAGAMLAIGLLAERRELYRTFGRALLSGGWAAIYFVTFATHFIAAARVIESPMVATGALMVAAAAAVAFSFRYRNEWTTVFAFLLIHLTLGIAALLHLASFNLLGAAIGAGALAVISWRKGWVRLLALGGLASWFTLGMWLLPQLEIWSHAERIVALPAVLASLVATWLALTVAIVERRQGPGDGWLVLAFLGNLAGGAGLLMYAVHRVYPDHTWLVAAGLGIAYLIAAWRLSRHGRDLLFRLAPMVAMVGVGAAVPLKLGMGAGWVPIWLLAVTQLMLIAGVVLREFSFRAVAHAALTVILGGIAVADLGLLPTDPRWALVPFRTPVVLAAAVLCLANSALSRGPWRTVLIRGERPAAAYALAAVGTLALLPPIFWEVPRMWIAPALVAIAALWALLGRQRSFTDLKVEAALLGPAAVVVMCALNLAPPPEVASAIRPASIGLTLALLYGAYALLVGRSGSNPDQPLSAGERALAVLYSALGGVALVALIWNDVPDPWIAPTLALTVLAHLELARRFGLPELLAEGAGLALAASAALAAISWDLAGTSLALPARVLSVAATSALLYGAVLLVGRMRSDEATSASGTRRRLLGALAVGLLAIPTLAVGWLIRDEAALAGRDEWVALAWAGMGLAYLGVSIARRSRVWGAFGTALGVAGAVHLWIVNLGGSDPADPAGLRMGLVAAFLLQLDLLYRLLKRAGERAGDALATGVARVCVIWLGTISAGWLLFNELTAQWVPTGWAALALALLGAHLLTGNERWRWPALATAATAVIYALVVDVWLWDAATAVPVEGLALPLCCAALLAGYGVQRVRELMLGEGDQSLLLSLPRLAWLAGFAALLTGTIAVHAEGTALTIWLSIEGMVLVALGFGLRERTARVAGLALLSGCILKLFVYDLRGLTGIPRILSFVVLGLVLIAVSFVYTRFRARLTRYL